MLFSFRFPPYFCFGVIPDNIHHHTSLNSLYGSADDQPTGDHDAVDEGRLGMLDQADEPLRGDLTKFFRVLAVSCEPKHASEVDAVVAERGNIVGHAKPHFCEDIHATDIGIIVWEKDAGRSVGKCEKFARFLSTSVGVVVDTFADILARDVKPQFLTSAVEAREAIARDRCKFAMQECDLAMAVVVSEANERVRTADIIGNDCEAIVENVVDGDERDTAIDQLPHARIVEIHTCDDHAVHTAVKAMLYIRGRLATDIVIDERDVIAVALGFDLEAFEHGREILMRKTASHLINEKDAEIVSPVRLESTRGGVGHVAHLLCDGADAVACLFADIRLTVERLTDRRNGNSATLRNILHGYHRHSSLLTKWVVIVFVALI